MQDSRVVHLLNMVLNRETFVSIRLDIQVNRLASFLVPGTLPIRKLETHIFDTYIMAVSIWPPLSLLILELVDTSPILLCRCNTIASQMYPETALFSTRRVKDKCDAWHVLFHLQIHHCYPSIQVPMTKLMRSKLNYSTSPKTMRMTGRKMASLKQEKTISLTWVRHFVCVVCKRRWCMDFFPFKDFA